VPRPVFKTGLAGIALAGARLSPLRQNFRFFFRM